MKDINISIIGLSGESIFLGVDSFNKSGETKNAKSLFIEPGGKGYNQAVACKRLGANVSFLSSVGDDEYGKICDNFLVQEGIKSFLKFKDNKTALACIMTENSGENMVTVYKGASEELDLNDLESFKEEIKNSDILLVNNEIPYDVLKMAIKYAKENNTYVILNPAPAIYDLSEIINDIDLLIPNRNEAEMIFKKDVNLINSKDINNDLIITLGKDGSKLITKDEETLFPSIKTNVVDTTGAGDVFCAAIATKVLNSDIKDAIMFATKCSSKHIEKMHVMDAIPYLKDIK